MCGDDAEPRSTLLDIQRVVIRSERDWRVHVAMMA
jgi:hypothetical protein